MLKKINKKIERSGGFALLFSVLLSSLLLTIGLSIFGIAIKELSISTNARQSVYAFFAADSGRECALFWDIKMGKIPNLIAGTNSGTITCGGTSTTTSNIIYSPLVGWEDASPASVTSHIPTISVTNDNSRPNFDVTITKTITDRGLSSSTINSKVISNGFDSTNSDKVERTIEQNY